MDALTAIHTRRSIRKFEDRPVPEELIQKLLAAAMQRPERGTPNHGSSW